MDGVEVWMSRKSPGFTQPMIDGVTDRCQFIPTSDVTATAWVGVA